MEAAGGASKRAASRGLNTPHTTALRMAEASGALRRAAPRELKTIRSTSDELTVLYSNGPDDRSVNLALGYVTAATSGCSPHPGIEVREQHGKEAEKGARATAAAGRTC
jgi:hypothetical protein